MLKYMFPPEGLKFLQGLARNNNREWFQARKEIFETQVKAPMIALIEQVNADLMDIAPDHVTDPKKSFYRIYRDTRFSADKTPYKTHVAAVFPRRGMEKHSSGGFYFHIAPKNVMVVAGLYMPTPEQLREVRSFISANHGAFRKASAAAAKVMGGIQGESVSRMPKGFAADHPAADLIRMKQWIHAVELDVEVATTRKLLNEIVKRFRAAAPVVEILNASALRAAAATTGTLL
jgi:uncharacterized protein (TIGR02453 family)